MVLAWLSLAAAWADERLAFHPSLGAHLIVSRLGVGVGVDAHVLGAVLSGYDVDEHGAEVGVGALGPFVAADVMPGRGPSVSVGGRAFAGSAKVAGTSFAPVAVGGVGLGYSRSHGRANLRAEGRIRSHLLDAGAYALRDGKGGAVPPRHPPHRGYAHPPPRRCARSSTTPRPPTPTLPATPP